MPLIAPTAERGRIASGTASQIGSPDDIDHAESPCRISTRIEPTDRSMPPVTMTAVMPTADDADEGEVAGDVEEVLRRREDGLAARGVSMRRTPRPTDRQATKTQNVRWSNHASERARGDASLDDDHGRFRRVLVQIMAAGGVDRAGDEAGHLLGRALAIGLSATLPPRRSTTMRSATAKTSGMRWLISTTAMPWSRRWRIRFSTSAT